MGCVAAVQSLFGGEALDDHPLGILDEDDDVGQFHRHVLANLRARWSAESDGRLRGPMST